MSNAQSFSGAQLFLSFIVSTFCAFAAAHFAEKKGRSNLGWFILGFTFAIFALVVLYFLPPLKEEKLINEEREKENLNEEEIVLESSNTEAVSSSLPLPFETQPDLVNQLWFYLDKDHQQIGPVSFIALKEEWRQGLINLHSYVWSEGMEKWQRVDELAELKLHLNETLPM